MIYESDSLQLQLSYGTAEVRFRAPTSWRDVVTALNAALDVLGQRLALDLVVIRDFGSLPQRANDAESISREGQRLSARIASLPIPTIAFIDGQCRGPALELALACSWRTASAQLGTQFGASGIACWCGTARLPQLVGRSSASRCLAGTAILTASQAYDLGLLDCIWSPRFAEVGLLGLQLQLQQNPRTPSSLFRRWRRWHTKPLPAPSQLPTWLLRAVDRGLRYGPEEALVVERAAARAFLANRTSSVRHAA